MRTQPPDILGSGPESAGAPPRTSTSGFTSFGMEGNTGEPAGGAPTLGGGGAPPESDDDRSETAAGGNDEAPDAHPSPWVALSGVLRGIQLHKPTLTWSTDSVAFSRRGVAINDRVASSDVSADSTTSAGESKFLSWGFSKSAAAVAAHWDVTKSEDSNHDLTIPPSEFVTALQLFPRVIVQADFTDLEPHPDFVEDIANAVLRPSVEEQESALRLVLMAWGHVVPIVVEIGSSIGTTIKLPCIRGGQTDAVDAALQARLTKPSDEWFELASALRLRTTGGPPAVFCIPSEVASWVKATNDERFWSVVGIKRLHRTIDLLQASHEGLFNQADFLCKRMLISPPAPTSPPIYHFEGCHTSFKHVNGWTYRMYGFFQTNIDDFAFENEFTISTWVLSGKQGGSACAVSIESSAWRENVIRIGEYHNEGYFSALYHRGRVRPSADMFHRLDSKSMGKKLTLERWYHLAFVRSRERIQFFVDGNRVDKHHVGLYNGGPLLKARDFRLCIGRGAWEDKACDQWDGAVQGVKVWNRALKAAEIEGEAGERNRPSPAGWEVPRYPREEEKPSGESSWWPL